MDFQFCPGGCYVKIPADPVFKWNVLFCDFTLAKAQMSTLKIMIEMDHFFPPWWFEIIRATKFLFLNGPIYLPYGGKIKPNTNQSSIESTKLKKKKDDLWDVFCKIWP